MTSTSYEFYPDETWAVSFENFFGSGIEFVGSKSDNGYARAVRGGF